MAAAAIIDLGIIMRLAAGLFNSITGVALVNLGEEEPTEESTWARFAGMTVETTERQRSDDEPDHANVAIHIEVVVSPSNTGSYGIGTAASRVRLAFDGQSAFDPVLPALFVHRLEILKTVIQIESDPDKERRNRFATVMIHGRAERRTGTSIEDH